ncbi:hypothetical protein [Streptomyces corynorhini]|uniref:Peptidase n=1 Tax=Streptomyces corynorhini TaxID=2282652 RepID=A0A370BAJ6_9ACTN|nr:hypothetical protein [Streptomyces corynorhini]RDG37409.1 hypothetical protein DVH02_14725 [Streptomyces corynorhini]
MLRRLRTRGPIRITGRPAALAASLAVLLATASAPAAADGSGEVALRLEAPADFILYHADEGAEALNSDFVIPVAVEASADGPARGVRVVVDASGLEGVARPEKGGGGNCTGKSVVFTCVYGDVQNGDGESNTPFILRGVDGVEPGDSGTVTYTVTADNAPTVTGTTRMTVGGPTLRTPEGEDEKTVEGAEPGTPVALSPRFANHSRFTAERGVALHLTTEGGVLTSRPRNCHFDTGFTSAWCLFATKAAPGSAYRTAAPIGFAAAAGKLTGSLSYTWSSDPRKPEGHTARGTDAPLPLTATADRGLTHDSAEIRLDTTVQADYEPVTATVRGRVGTTVKVRLGVRDHGPGRLRDVAAMDPELMGGFEVIPPEGTTVTSIPYTFEDSGGSWACARPEKPGGAFVCAIGFDSFGEVRHEGGVTAIDFHIRIDRQVPGARGTIRTHNPYDRTPGNDTAAIPLDAAPAPLYANPVVWSGAAGAVAVVVAVAAYRRRRAGRGVDRP